MLVTSVPKEIPLITALEKGCLDTPFVTLFGELCKVSKFIFELVNTLLVIVSNVEGNLISTGSPALEFKLANAPSSIQRRPSLKVILVTLRNPLNADWPMYLKVEGKTMDRMPEAEGNALVLIAVIPSGITKSPEQEELLMMVVPEVVYVPLTEQLTVDALAGEMVTSKLTDTEITEAKTENLFKATPVQIDDPFEVDRILNYKSRS